ncbi:SDR family oxidoreductase [Microbulbifer sp. SAOS-129_SWC]|uniref:SDR family NAD(P)-dependent oxidoreductase n=1 Tax=Microbulbifer sp. SAOS-129_SWC TaxID=3145235 RepID=UPI0032164A79
MPEGNKARCALITGANGGVGQALVARFLSEGYSVIATDIQKEYIGENGDVCYVRADLNRYVQESLYADQVNFRIEEALVGRELYVLINNAAVQLLGSTESLSRDDWARTLNVNLMACFFLAQSLIKDLEKTAGSIVNISSIHASLSKKGFLAYATSKAALSALTKNLALDLGSRVRINAIEPAAIDTEMLREGFRESPEALAELKSFHPVGRIGSPHEVADLAVYLCSDGAGFINGATVSLSGGIHGRLFDPV